MFLVGVLGQEWESAEIHSRTPYKAFSSHEIEADIGMKIGLASVNITLKSQLHSIVRKTSTFNVCQKTAVVAWATKRLQAGLLSKISLFCQTTDLQVKGTTTTSRVREKGWP